MSKVKLRLSGGLAFAANLVGYLTGFIFTVLITRRLSAEEFGVWALISSLIVYSLIPYDLVGSWIMRDAARGKKVLDTALVLCLLLSPISILIYILSGVGSASAINYDAATILLGLMVLAPYISLSMASAVQGGYMPQRIGVSRIIFEISKVLFAFLFLILLGLRLIGALLSLSLAYAVQAGFLLYNSKSLRQKINTSWILKWLKGAPANIIDVLDKALSATNIVLMSVILGNAAIAGYWQAAVSASALVTSSRLLATGLGARLLSGGSQRDVDKSFSFCMMLAIPLLLGFLVLSRDLLWLLNPIYSPAWIAACILAVAGITRFVGNIGATVLTGTDEFDRGDTITFKDYLKSRVFMVNGLRTTLTGLNLATVAAYLITAGRTASMVEIITSVAVINLMWAIVGAIINLKLMRKMTPFKLNLSTLKPYLISAIVMALAVYLIREALGFKPARALEAGCQILLLVIIGGAIYGGILYLISKEFRRFLREVKNFINSYKLTDIL